MESSINELLTYAGTGIGSIFLYLFAKNERMREGITDSLLSRMNQTKIKKIPLGSHKLFASLAQRQSSLATFIIDDPVKMHFYTTYIAITFEQIRWGANEIIKAEIEGVALEQDVMVIVNKMQAQIESCIELKLHIPDKVKPSFNKWRAMLTNAFSESVSDIAHDDLFENNYFLAYRILDVFSFYVATLLHTGAVEMARLNGSFKGLTIEQIEK
jgi:hypothetical protein